MVIWQTNGRLRSHVLYLLRPFSELLWNLLLVERCVCVCVPKKYSLSRRKRTISWGGKRNLYRIKDILHAFSKKGAKVRMRGEEARGSEAVWNLFLWLKKENRRSRELKFRNSWWKWVEKLDLGEEEKKEKESSGASLGVARGQLKSKSGRKPLSDPREY